MRVDMYNMRKMNNYNQSVYLFKIFKIQNFSSLS